MQSQFSLPHLVAGVGTTDEPSCFRIQELVEQFLARGEAYARSLDYAPSRQAVATRDVLRRLEGATRDLAGAVRASGSADRGAER